MPAGSQRAATLVRYGFDLETMLSKYGSRGIKEDFPTSSSGFRMNVHTNACSFIPCVPTHMQNTQTHTHISKQKIKTNN